MTNNKKQTSPKIIEFLDTGIFTPVVMLSIGFSYDEIIKELTKMGAKEWILGLSDDKEHIDRAHALCLYRSFENTKTGKWIRLYYIILKKPFDYSTDDYVVLAHEIVHACQFISDGIFDRNKEIEAEAYLHSHLMRQCLEALEEKKSKNKMK